LRWFRARPGRPVEGLDRRVEPTDPSLGLAQGADDVTKCHTHSERFAGLISFVRFAERAARPSTKPLEIAYSRALHTNRSIGVTLYARILYRGSYNEMAGECPPGSRGRPHRPCLPRPGQHRAPYLTGRSHGEAEFAPKPCSSPNLWRASPLSMWRASPLSRGERHHSPSLPDRKVSP